jgi:hypothetical protein
MKKLIMCLMLTGCLTETYVVAHYSRITDTKAIVRCIENEGHCFKMMYSACNNPTLLYQGKGTDRKSWWIVFDCSQEVKGK